MRLIYSFSGGPPGVLEPPGLLLYNSRDHLGLGHAVTRGRLRLAATATTDEERGEDGEKSHRFHAGFFQL